MRENGERKTQREQESSAICMLESGESATRIKSRLRNLVIGLKQPAREKVRETPETPIFEADDFIGQAMFWLGMAARERDQELKKYYMSNAHEKVKLAEANLSEKQSKTKPIETRKL